MLVVEYSMTLNTTTGKLGASPRGEMLQLLSLAANLSNIKNITFIAPGQAIVLCLRYRHMENQIAEALFHIIV